MNEMNIKSPTGSIYEIVAWLISGLVLLFGYNYIKEIIEYVLLKLYEFFIQRKSFN